MSTAAHSEPTPGPLGGAFTRVVAANLSSSLGDGIARVAAPLLAARLTNDPLLVSLVAVAALLPWLLFAIPAGVLVDRIDRRLALGLAGGVRALVAAGLLALHVTGALTIWWLLLVVFLYGIQETVYDGAIRAVIPSLVGRRDLPRANSRIEATEIVVQQFLSQPLTSWLLAFSAVWALGLNTAAYAVAGGLALTLPAVASGLAGRRFGGRAAPGRGATPGASEAPEGGPSYGAAPMAAGWRAELVTGFRFIWGSAMLRPLWVVSVLIGVCHAAIMSTLVLFILERLHVPEAWYGAFMLAGAVGSLSAAAATNRLKTRFGTGPVMAAANAIGLGAWFLAGAFPLAWVGAVAIFVSFGCTTAWNVLVMSLRQAAVPNQLLGRVHGTWRTALWGAMPLGSLIGGLLARDGYSTPLIVGATAGLMISAVGHRYIVSLPDPEKLDPA
ncbi:MFS transporter [Promicromonospora soli]|uniref:MFS transporter n=1 Tax=Promicromonospora soli TaxID=2035533 RepID=A0A919KT23_9MICO|nr:MFS transporter [Promicromonospora soli]GHH71488.1 MFS transporter [Promicromonospora soli]